MKSSINISLYALILSLLGPLALTLTACGGAAGSDSVAVAEPTPTDPGTEDPEPPDPTAPTEPPDEPSGASFTLVDTGQTICYSDSGVISAPAIGADYYGQDPQYDGPVMRYTDNNDGTVTDQSTGLMWQQDPGSKVTFAQAVAGAASYELAGHDDWRLPTIKELYSLIDFSGVTGTSAATSTPYIDTAYFDFSYGDESTERFIDSQWVTSTEYVTTTMNGDHTVFGVNFADGRIKGYGTSTPGGGKTF